MNNHIVIMIDAQDAEHGQMNWLLTDIKHRLGILSRADVDVAQIPSISPEDAADVDFMYFDRARVVCLGKRVYEDLAAFRGYRGENVFLLPSFGGHNIDENVYEECKEWLENGK